MSQTYNAQLGTLESIVFTECEQGSCQRISKSLLISMCRRIENCCALAACALVVFEHLSTLPREIELVWSQKFNAVVFLFHFNRWAIIIWTVAVVAEVVLRRKFDCIGMNYFADFVTLVVYTIWAVFSAIRIYAVSHGNWISTIVVFMLNLVPVGTNAYGWYGTYWFQVVVLPVLGAECDIGKNISLSTFIKFTIATRICVIAADVLVIAMTWSKTYSLKRASDSVGMKSPLTTFLLRDGSWYLAYHMTEQCNLTEFGIHRASLCLNVIMLAGNTTNVFAFAGSFEQPIQTIIITRFLLNLRHVSNQPRDGTSTNALESIPARSSLRFASFVGSMGADLGYKVDSRVDGIDLDIDDANRTAQDNEYSSMGTTNSLLPLTIILRQLFSLLSDHSFTLTLRVAESIFVPVYESVSAQGTVYVGIASA
ncbi:hypothetical protein CERSUDRAFT_77459 [Gelatoporia subvermispora B]|uniref:DUF6533 domain-containing protein n=1 Tax=Ceriporiopsis subvermispora (strain B) TaxID=914234 RepID=M2R0T9_CERS8|nr:hypothetical protein CERSUDRAFT_77459 [Gelatoporia subvermispora B]